MNYFKIVQGYYDKGFYTNDMVKVFVERSKITAEEYETITGEPYVSQI